ncbi:T9SS type A sorting domain-containing protein [Mariniflexile sp. AS56]|uniref:T9SS type A sorting domain-containing protein n=1 Tax=Mariniflexile sp. AS56 TaxID=3063957 RepID=UPI0026F2E700|nr:T9SS type A sorting domain-containing protein [Mariniflexile sp. AS56]MDO7173571.1 T9SS type A sorting domain-containing protein [Mariniflexile sp. AS56]
MLSKRKCTLLCLLFVVFMHAQDSPKLAQEIATTSKNEAPNISGSAVLNHTLDTIDLMGEIADTKDAVILESGFVFSTSETLPTVLDTKIITESIGGSFTHKLVDLTANSMYYIRSFTITDGGVFYGNLSTIDTSTQSNIDVSLKTRIKTYPNPSTSYISLSGLMDTKNYIIYSMTGKELARGTVSYNNKIDVRFLENGMYLLKLDDLDIIKFIKE